LGDDEGYYCLPGSKVGEVITKLTAVAEANRQLESFHKARATPTS
jgi:hypothetical protein